MTRIFTVIIVLLSFCVSLHPQGFDWHKSARMPWNVPTSFGGAILDAGMVLHSGQLPYFEQYPCCTYTDALGGRGQAGIAYEEWMSGYMALTVSAGYEIRSAVFTAPGDVIPLVTGGNAVTSWRYSVLTHSVFTLLGLRFKDAGTGFSLTGGFGLRFIGSTDTEHRQQIDSPDNVFFDNGTRSRYRTVQSVPATLRQFSVSPFIELGRDFSLAHGTYLCPSVALTFPVASAAAGSKWYIMDVSARLRIFTALW